MDPRRSLTRGSARALIPILATMYLTVLIAPGAQAVHDVSVFQLDEPADAQVDVGETDHREDWDVICEDNASSCDLKSGFETSLTSNSTSSSHENDGGLNSTIFQGGGSKDIYGIGSWLWKNDAGGLPDKDNLLHAYAARYSVAPSATCPVASGLSSCDLIYFGSDRYDNNGDATQAFWFLQSELTLGSTAKGGGFTFDGQHTTGDLLIISEFSNGGSKSTITVYKWVGNDATGSLQFLAGGDNQKCGGSTPDPFCGIVNEGTDPIDSPWPFLDKGGSTQFRQGELFEAGINLSAPGINLAGECFSSFVAETRSSTSTSAQLKDFVLGEFETCEAGMTTQASSNGIVAPGTAVTDAATISVTGAASPDDPTGDVTFFLCSNATNGCPTGGTNVGTGALAGGSNTSDGVAVATSPQVNTSGSPLAPGRYCFRAEWPGDDNYDAVSHTNNTTECFTVQDTTSLSTRQRWLPNDRATITSGAGTNVSGSVLFQLYNDGTCGAGTGTVQYSETVGPFTNQTSPHTVNTSNTTFIVNDASEGSYSWKVTFTSSDPNVASPSSSTCESTTISITD